MKTLLQMILMVVFWLIFTWLLFQLSKRVSPESDPDNMVTGCGIFAIALSIAAVVVIS